MRLNDDNKTVAAMDILFPGIGEIVGGSQREERLEVLQKRMADFNIPEEEMDWFQNHWPLFVDCQQVGGQDSAGQSFRLQRGGGRLDWPPQPTRW